MGTSTPLTARVTYHRPRSSRSIKTGFYLAYYAPGTQGPLTYKYSAALYPPPTSSSDTLTQVVPIDHDGNNNENKYLVELGTYVDYPHPASRSPDPDSETDRRKQHLLTIKHLSILPASTVSLTSKYQITALHLITRTPHPDTTVDSQTRLVWSWHALAPSTSPAGSPDTSDLPCSRTTGPFAHFVVTLNGRYAGRTYACEFPLRKGDFVDAGTDGSGEGEGEGEVEVCVEGVLFGFGFAERDRVRSAVVKFRVGGNEGENDD